ncbi:uncharacterized protein LOC144709196 isoform X3 [Wolffia australiana]
MSVASQGILPESAGFALAPEGWEVEDAGVLAPGVEEAQAMAEGATVHETERLAAAASHPAVGEASHPADAVSHPAAAASHPAAAASHLVVVASHPAAEASLPAVAVYHPTAAASLLVIAVSLPAVAVSRPVTSVSPLPAGVFPLPAAVPPLIVAVSPLRLAASPLTVVASPLAIKACHLTVILFPLATAACLLSIATSPLVTKACLLVTRASRQDVIVSHLQTTSLPLVPKAVPHPMTMHLLAAVPLPKTEASPRTAALAAPLRGGLAPHPIAKATMTTGQDLHHTSAKMMNHLMLMATLTGNSAVAGLSSSASIPSSAAARLQTMVVAPT